MKEIWKIYKTTQSSRWGKRIYEISNLGRVKINGVVINPPICGRYYRVSNVALHRVVAELFIPNPENKPFVDHIDTNTFNNCVSNLRWVTASENRLNPISNSKFIKSHTGQRWNISEASKNKIRNATKGRFLNKHWKLVDGKRKWLDMTPEEIQKEPRKNQDSNPLW